MRRLPGALVYVAFSVALTCSGCLASQILTDAKRLVQVLLDAEDQQDKANAMLTIGIFTMSSSEAQNGVIAHGGIEAIVEVLDHGTISTKIHAAVALGNLITTGLHDAAGDANMAAIVSAAIVNAGGLERLVQNLVTAEDTNFKEALMIATLATIKGSTPAQQALREIVGGVGVIIHHFADTKFPLRTRRVILTVIANMAADDREIGRLLVEHGAIEAISDYAKACSGDKKRAGEEQVAFNVLYSLAAIDKSYARRIRALGIRFSGEGVEQMKEFDRQIEARSYLSALKKLRKRASAVLRGRGMSVAFLGVAACFFLFAAGHVVYTAWKFKRRRKMRGTGGKGR